jgi:hypothetical protein
MPRSFQILKNSRDNYQNRLVSFKGCAENFKGLGENFKGFSETSKGHVRISKSRSVIFKGCDEKSIDCSPNFKGHGENFKDRGDNSKVCSSTFKGRGGIFRAKSAKVAKGKDFSFGFLHVLRATQKIFSNHAIAGGWIMQSFWPDLVWQKQ